MEEQILKRILDSLLVGKSTAIAVIKDTFRITELSGRESLIVQLAFELDLLKERMERIRELADNGNSEGDLIEIVNICDTRTAYEDV